MKILIVGDSITKGTVGFSYVDQVRKLMHGSLITSEGKNGDTLNCIAFRLLKLLDENASYDRIVIQAGYNDILLPHFLSKGKLFRLAYSIQKRKGISPLRTASAYEDFLCDLLDQVSRKTNAVIVLCTIGPVNEWQGSATNFKRLQYNDSIRRVAKRYNCLLADAGKAADLIIDKSTGTNYCLPGFWKSLCWDPFVSRIPGVANSLSCNRKLQLTIDGVHPNKKGAYLFSRAVLDAIHAPVHSIQAMRL